MLSVCGIRRDSHESRIAFIVGHILVFIVTCIYTYFFRSPMWYSKSVRIFPAWFGPDHDVFRGGTHCARGHC